MNRRQYIKWSLAGVAGSGHAQSSASNVLQAGPFAVTAPSEWSKTAIVEKVPLRPLYSASAWNDFQGNRRYRLKPAYSCRPEHWALRFPSALPKGILFDLKRAGEDETAPQILIHKAAQWDICFTDGVNETSKKDQLLRSMRKRMDDVFTHDEPDASPAFTDASLTFQCLKRRIDFKGGHGVRLVAQWTIEPDLMRFRCLHYLFLGMSDDDSCQIMATFPLSLEGLPSLDDRNHLGWSMDRYDELSKSFDRYENEAKRWVETHVEKINPTLHTLDAMMHSLVAPRWTE
jgi:hypothetical protein